MEAAQPDASPRVRSRITEKIDSRNVYRTNAIRFMTPNSIAAFLLRETMSYVDNYAYPIYVRQGRNRTKFKAGFINAAGKTVIDPHFDDARPFSEGLAPVRLNGKWGAIDRSGVFVIPCTHQGVGLKFSEGKIEFTVGNRHGILGRDGSIIVPPKYHAISPFNEGAAYVWDGKQYGFINELGQEFIPLFFEDVREFSHGLAPVKLGGKWGYIDRKAHFVIEPRFDFALPFHNHLARVAVGGRWGPFGFINTLGEIVIPVQFRSAYDFQEGLAAAATEKKGPWGYINKHGQFTILPVYRYVKQFSEGLAAVSPVGERMTHFITANGERAFSGEYLGTNSFEKQRCLVSSIKTISYIDREGRMIWEGPYVRRV